MAFETLNDGRGEGKASGSAQKLATIVAAMLRCPDMYRFRRHGQNDESGGDAHRESLEFLDNLSSDTMIQALRKLYREGEREARKRAAGLARLIKSRTH